ncbi:MAG: helix-turn-helix domain-containing protein [Acidiferrobacterales bacterium]
MQKSIGSRAFAHFVTCLRQAREQAGVTQEELALRLGTTQSFVSKSERGERRMDLVELRLFCHAIGITLEKFVRQFEKTLP